MKRIFGFFFCACVPLAGLAQDEQTFVGEKLLPSSAQLSQAVLGKGYDIAQERFAGDCVNGEVEYVGAASGSISFERSLSSNEMSDSLGFSVGARARYGMISGSVAARFASESISNEYSEVTIYASEYRFKNAKLTKPTFTAQGLAAANGQTNHVGELWERSCGQGFVEQIELGAKFMLSAKVEFSTKEDKQAFSAEFKIKGPAFAVRGELSKASRRFGKTASVTIRAFQLGGDVARMSALFGVGEKAKIDVDGQKVHALLVCSMDQMDACLQVLDNAISYATDTNDALSFPNQIRPLYNPTQPHGPAELAYVVKPWSDVAIYLQPQIMKAVTKAARGELARRFEELLKVRTRVNSLLSGPFRLSRRQYDLVDEASNALNGNLAVIKDAVSVCYSEPELCANRVARLKGELVVLSSSALDIFPESFVQWCDLYEAGVAGTSVKNTLMALFGAIQGELDTSNTTDKCIAAQAILKDKKELNLGMSGIESLIPLADLISLERLYLFGNRITDLEPLRNMVAMRKLNVNANDIGDLSALKGMTNLESLSASNNRIEDLSEAPWPKLRTLTLGDNRIKDLSFLATLGALETLDVSNNKLKELEGMAHLKALRSVSVSNNAITNLEPLVGLPRLNELHLDNNPGACPSELRDLCKNLEL